MRVSRQSPENTRFFHATSTELGQGKEDAELQEAERGSSGAGRRLSQENDRTSLLRGCSRQCLCHLAWEACKAKFCPTGGGTVCLTTSRIL